MALAKRIPDQVARALYQEAEIEMGEAQERTPVDTGALKGSGYVAPPEVHGREISVELGFGGPAAEYAVFVHEDLDAFHKVGQARFLSSTLEESEPYLAQRIGQRLNLAALIGS